MDVSILGMLLHVLHHFGIPGSPEGLFVATASPQDGAATGGVQQLQQFSTHTKPHIHIGVRHITITYSLTHMPSGCVHTVNA